MSRRVLIKILHELGAIGLMGSLVVYLVLVLTLPGASPAGEAAVREGIASVTAWVLAPAMAVCLASGLLALTSSRSYMNARWAWIKALLGLGLFEGTLLAQQHARRAADLALQVAAGESTPAALAQVARAEWTGLWLLLAISLINVVLGVWRPRLRAGGTDDTSASAQMP